MLEISDSLEASRTFYSHLRARGFPDLTPSHPKFKFKPLHESVSKQTSSFPLMKPHKFPHFGKKKPKQNYKASHPAEHMAIKKPIKPIKPNEGVITCITAKRQSVLTVMKYSKRDLFRRQLFLSLCLSSKLQLISRTRHFLLVTQERGRGRKKTRSCGQRRLFQSSSRCCECLRVELKLRCV